MYQNIPSTPKRFLWQQLRTYYQGHPALRSNPDEPVPLHLIRKLSIQNGLAERRLKQQPSNFVKLNLFLRGLLPTLVKIEHYLTLSLGWSHKQAQAHLFMVGQLILDGLTQKTGGKEDERQ
jgi:hypothetical protein